MEHLNSKVLLFGEYALLHQGMALVIPCDKYQGRFSFYEKAKDKKFALQSNEFLKKFCEFAAAHMDERFVLEVKQLEKELNEGLFFESDIPQGYGLGSSGALVAAIFLRYLRKAKDLKDGLKAVTFQKLASLKEVLGKMESFFHGVSSGLDPLSIILNKPILYKSAKEIVLPDLPPATQGKKNSIFLINSQKAHSTAAMMELFKELYSHEAFKTKFQKDLIANNNDGIEYFLNGDLENFYQSLYKISSFQLDEMSAFFPTTLQPEVKKGLNNGDYFLKLCGAGGGGFTLGFTRDWHQTKKSLKNYDLKVIHNF